MESPSPGAAIQHQAQGQPPDPSNPNSNPPRYRNRNRPRPRVPPANADSLVTPPTDGTGTKSPQRNNPPRRNREQGSLGPRNPPTAPQAAGSSSTADGTYGADVRPPQTKRTRPPKRRQQASATNEPQVVDSALTQPKPTSQRPSRRSKFNTALSEPTPLSGDSKLNPQANLPAQVSSKPSRAKPSRSKASPADDLTSTLIHALSTPPYPDCPICFNAIRPEQPTWSCSSSDPSENLQCCWTTFHLKCI